jgi:hypothetical protein
MITTAIGSSTSGTASWRVASMPSRTGVLGPAELENPTRHRDGDPVSGKVTDEREHHSPGRFAWDRYAAARRST